MPNHLVVNDGEYSPSRKGFNARNPLLHPDIPLAAYSAGQCIFNNASHESE